MLTSVQEEQVEKILRRVDLERQGDRLRREIWAAIGCADHGRDRFTGERLERMGDEEIDGSIQQSRERAVCEIIGNCCDLPGAPILSQGGRSAGNPTA